MYESTVKKNTYFMALNQAGQQILAFILIKAAAGRLGDAGFGIYMFASAMSYFVLLSNDLGLATYITREVAKSKERAAALFVNGFALKLILLLISVPFLGVFLLISRSNPQKMWSVLAFGVFGLFTSMNQLCGAIYRAHERMEYEMAVTLFEKVIITVVGLWFVLNGYGVAFMCGAFSLASLVSFILNFSLIRSHFIHERASVSLALMKPLLTASLTFGLFWIITNVHERIDVLMLERLTNDAIVGWYTLAYKLILIAGLIPMILMTATFPRISRAVHHDPEEVKRIFRLGNKYLILIVLPMLVGTQFLARDICLFFGKDFARSGPVLRLLIFASGVDFFSIFLSGFLMAWNRQKRLLWLQCGALFLNVTANFILIPYFQHMGAALATLASRGLIFALCTFWVGSRMREFDLSALPFGLVSTGVMAIFLWVWQGPLLARIGLAVFIYIGLLLLMGGIRPAEIFMVRRNRNDEGNTYDE
jgi:O-antigen/teichoic acid export membrane protein